MFHLCLPYDLKDLSIFDRFNSHNIVSSTKNSLAASHDKSEVCLSTRCEMNYLSKFIGYLSQLTI
jgi:hypothetical protein